MVTHEVGRFMVTHEVGRSMVTHEVGGKSPDEPLSSEKTSKQKTVKLHAKCSSSLPINLSL